MQRADDHYDEDLGDLNDRNNAREEQEDFDRANGIPSENFDNFFKSV